MSSPLFSICIPTYNSGSIVQKTIESCINQLYKNYEVLIVDDHSNDNTVEVINSYKQFSFIKIYVNEQNIGLTANWNKCLKLAKGKYIAFVHHDDAITPNYLLDASLILSENNNIGIISFENQTQASSPFCGRVSHKDYFNYIFKWKYLIAPSQAVFINLSELNYDPSLNYCPEAEIYLAILKKKYDVYFSEKRNSIRNTTWQMNVTTRYKYSWRTFKDRILITKKWQNDSWLDKKFIFQGLLTTSVNIYERRARAIVLRVKENADPLIANLLSALKENNWFGMTILQQLIIRIAGCFGYIKKFTTTCLRRLIKGKE